MPYFKGSKKGVFSPIFDPTVVLKPLLWLVPIIYPPNHNTSSEDCFRRRMYPISLRYRSSSWTFLTWGLPLLTTHFVPCKQGYDFNMPWEVNKDVVEGYYLLGGRIYFLGKALIYTSHSNHPRKKFASISHFLSFSIFREGWYVLIKLSIFLTSTNSLF